MTRSAHATIALLLTSALLAAAPAGALSSKKAAEGLKEALSVGTGSAVELLGQVDGYLSRPEVRIEIPKSLEKVEKVLVAIGEEERVEEFRTSMNRAAEAAAPVAKEIFLDAIKEMSFEDAMEILRGDDHAATEYLDEKSRARLKELFLPVVEEKLEEVDATAAFHRFNEKIKFYTSTERAAFDLSDYVTDKALDGLFYMVAQEEERIRKDVVARTSDLLKEVFGSLGESEKPEEGKKKSWWKRLGG